MKKITRFLFTVVVMVFTTIAFSQSTVTGTVVGSDLNAPLPGANIVERGTTNGTTTDFDGNFSLSTESSSGEIVISYVGYGSQTLSFSGNQDFGTITLSGDNTLEEVVIIGSGVIDLAEDRKTPVAVSTIKKQEIQERAIGNVEVPEIIKNTPSVFVSGQTGFGDSQIFMRGFDQTNIAVLLNGQPVNGMEDGRVYWSNWAGIADIANGVQVQRGLGSSKLAISSVGGTINLVMKSTDREKGGFVRFLGGNDSYFKGTVSYDTGLNEKGWSFSVLLDHWQAHRKWAEGTYGQGQTYFFSAGYKPNDTHAFNLLLTGAPQLHGQRWSQSLSTIEDDPKFNQHWGYTDDGIESERQNYYHKPVFNFNWDWNLSEKSDISTVAYASWGRGGGTGPRGRGRIRTDDGQIDYDAIIAQNTAAGSGGPSDDVYIRRSSVNNHQWFGLVSNFSTEVTENINFSLGADFRFYKGDHFRQVADLYGLSEWTDDGPNGATVTATYDPNPWASLFNFADEADRIDYDYSENINYQGVFGQIEYAKDRFSAFFQGSYSNQSYKRTQGEGFVSSDEVGTDIEKESDKVDKKGFNIKTGLSYELSESSTIFGNYGYYSRQPYLDNIFRDIRSSNQIFENPSVDNELIRAFELGYVLQTGDLRANLNFYHTDWSNRVILSTERIEDEDGEVIQENNVFDRGVRQIHKGVELDLQYRLTDGVTLTGYVSQGSWEYEGSSNVSVYDDETGNLVRTEEGTDRDGIKITNAPQFTAGFGARATNIVEGLTIFGNLNYYDRLWRNDGGSVQTENVGRIKPYSLTDLGLSYDFKVGDNSLTFIGNVYNIFDEVRVQNSDNFGFFNTNGITFNASLRYNF